MHFYRVQMHTLAAFEVVIFCAAVINKSLAPEAMMHRFTPLGNVTFFNITYNASRPRACARFYHAYAE